MDGVFVLIHSPLVGPFTWSREEPLPTVPGWLGAPCSYIQTSAGYASAAESARRAGWPVQVFAAGHFHMLVDPGAVARALLVA